MRIPFTEIQSKTLNPTFKTKYLKPWIYKAIAYKNENTSLGRETHAQDTNNFEKKP